MCQILKFIQQTAGWVYDQFYFEVYLWTVPIFLWSHILQYILKYFNLYLTKKAHDSSLIYNKLKLFHYKVFRILKMVWLRQGKICHKAIMSGALMCSNNPRARWMIVNASVCHYVTEKLRVKSA